MRFEAVTRATDRAFNVLALLGAFGSFLGGLIVLLSWLRSRKSDKLQRSDYERERQFYEQRVLDADERHIKPATRKRDSFMNLELPNSISVTRRATKWDSTYHDSLQAEMLISPSSRCSLAKKVLAH